MRLAVNEKVTFAEEDATPYTVQAVGPRFAVLTRPATGEDRELHEYEGDVDGLVVYTIINSETMTRGPHDRVFNGYEFPTTTGCEECLRDLESGEIALSRRRSIPVLPDSVEGLTQLVKEKVNP